MRALSQRFRDGLKSLSFRSSEDSSLPEYSDNCRSSNGSNSEIVSALRSKTGKLHGNEDRIVFFESLGEFVEDDGQVTEVYEDVDPTSSTSLIDSIQYHAVFDGHGGPVCSNFLAMSLHENIAKRGAKCTELSQFSTVLLDSFKEVDDAFKNHHSSDTSGSCALVALTHRNQAILGWVGDCRGVLYSNGKVSQVTHDHRCSNAKEYERILNNGGYIVNGRLAGALSPSRTFGDMDVLERIPDGCLISEPDITTFTLDDSQVQDSFLILASDGVWDVLTNEQACDIVFKSLKKSKGKAEIAANALVKHASKINSDDVSATVIVWGTSRSALSSAYSQRMQSSGGMFEVKDLDNGTPSSPTNKKKNSEEEPEKI